MRSAQKIALDPRLWVFVGVVMFSIGLFFYLDNGQGFLLLLVGSFIVFTTLYIWAAAALWRSRKTQHHPQAPPHVKPTDENEEIRYPESFHTPLQVGNADMSEPDTENETAILWHESKEPDKQLIPALCLHIQEEPLTVTHLLSTLTAFLSLYVKMWLLQQERFDDFVTYTEHKDRRFEEETNLLIAELKYNSPAVITIPIDKIPKAFAEALRILIDTFTQLKPRIDLIKEKATKAHLENTALRLDILNQTAKMVDNLSPKLNQEEQEIARQSLADDIVQLVKECTLEISGKPHRPAPVMEKSLVPSSLLKDLKREEAKVYA